MNYILRKSKIDDSALESVLSSGLSKGAKLLYAYLFKLRSGEIVNNQTIIKNNIVVSRAMIGNYKRELKKHGLIHENKDKTSNIRFIYLGSLSIPANVFAEDWKYEIVENTNED